MEVCSALKERYAQTIAELKEACQGLPTAAQEKKILQKSMEFCKEATAAGYGILWDPQA
jgi:chorismate mutase